MLLKWTPDRAMMWYNPMIDRAPRGLSNLVEVESRWQRGYIMLYMFHLGGMAPFSGENPDDCIV